MPANNIIKIRRGPASEWDATNPILASGEPGYDLTNKSLKIGDGITAWDDLTKIVEIFAGPGINISNNNNLYTISSSSSFIINNGRLTLDNTNAVTTNDISGSTALYFVPYLGNQTSLYNTNTNQWELFNFSTLTLNLSGMSSNTNYDIFLYNNNGTLTLDKIGWASNNSRSTNLAYQNGIAVSSSALNKKYLGTVRTTANTSFEDSSYRRFVFNVFNQANKLLVISDNVFHTYTNNTIRLYRNISTVGLTRGEFIVGIQNSVPIICNSLFATETGTSSVGLSINSTSSFNTSAINTTSVSSGPALVFTNSATDIVSTSIGHNYLQLLQSGSSVTTFYNVLAKAVLSC